MKVRRSVAAVIAIVCVLLLALAGVAEAVNLFTAPLLVFSSEGGLSCNLVNVGAGNVTVTIKIFQTNGAEVANSGPVVVPPGVVFNQGFSPINFAEFYYCKFMSSSSLVRVAIARFSASGEQFGYGNVK